MLEYALSGAPTTWSQYQQALTIEENMTVYARLRYLTETTEVPASLAITNIDKLPPLAFTPNIAKTTNSITVTATTTDAPSNRANACSGLAGYSFSKDGGKTWTAYQASGTYAFNNLTQGTTFKILAKAKDNVGNETIGGKDSGTDPIEIPTEEITGKITFGNAVWTKTSNSATVTVNVDKLQTGCNLQYKIGSNGTWTNITSGQSISPGQPSGTKVYARIWDGINEGPGTGYASTTIIDNVAPSKVTVDMHGYANGSWTNQDIHRTLNATDSESGIAYFEWGYDTNTVAGRCDRDLTYRDEDTNGTYYYRAVDYAGNVGSWSDAYTRRIDKTKPVVTTATATTNKINFTATDGNGVVAYAVTENNTAPTAGWTTVTSATSYSGSVTGKKQTTTYYVWAKDVAGNVSISKSVTTGTIPTPTTANLWVSGRNWSGINCTVTWATNTGFQIQVSNTPTVESSWETKNSKSVKSGKTTYARLFDGTNHSSWASDTPILRCKVTFNANGGSVSSTQMTVTYGESYPTLPRPTREGYTFVGWFTTSSGNYDDNYYYNTYGDLQTSFGSPTTEEWRFNHWINYGINEGRICSAENINNGSWGLTSKVTIVGDHTLYAQWKVNTYTITIDPNGGKLSNGDEWSTQIRSKKFTYGKKKMFASVHYYNGSENGYVCVFGTSWDGSTIQTFKRTGYTFNGWKVTSGSGSVTQEQCTRGDNNSLYYRWNYDGSYAGDVTVQAQWTAKQYKITFNGNGGTVNPSIWSDVKYNEWWACDNHDFIPTRNGYIFLGWYTSTSGGTQVYGANGYSTNEGTYYKEGFGWVYDGNVTLYAQWKVNSYTVSLSKATGISSVSGAGTYKPGDSVTVTASTSSGYSFNGWTGTYSSSYLSYTFTMPAANVSLIANASHTHTEECYAFRETGRKHEYMIADKQVFTKGHTQILFDWDPYFEYSYIFASNEDWTNKGAAEEWLFWIDFDNIRCEGKEGTGAIKYFSKTGPFEEPKGLCESWVYTTKGFTGRISISFYEAEKYVKCTK